MSSELPFADPRGRSVSGNSGLPSSLTPHREGSELHDQDHGYAENWQNPLPEIVSSGPTTAPASPVGGADGATEGTSHHDTGSSHHPDTAGTKESAMREDVWVEPKEAAWYRRISKLAWIIIVLTSVGILGVLLAILGAMGILSGERAGDSSLADRTGTAGTTGSISATSSTSSASPTSIDNPGRPHIDCRSPTTFLTSITWIGTDVGSYNGQFAQASSPEGCCNSCLSTAPGCAGWLYNASSVFTPCTMIIVTSSKGAEKDDSCPKGYAAQTYFSKGDEGDGVAGIGPCGGRVKVQ
ncbi:hypothetical protein VTI74DRAFT_11410 [Chaetomium olivicolor]